MLHPENRYLTAFSDYLIAQGLVPVLYVWSLMFLLKSFYYSHIALSNRLIPAVHKFAKFRQWQPASLPSCIQSQIPRPVTMPVNKIIPGFSLQFLHCGYNISKRKQSFPLSCICLVCTYFYVTDFFTSFQDMPELGLLRKFWLRRSNSCFCQAGTGIFALLIATLSHKSSTNWIFSATDSVSISYTVIRLLWNINR